MFKEREKNEREKGGEGRYHFIVMQHIAGEIILDEPHEDDGEEGRKKDH